LVLLIETVHIIANINGTASVSRLVWAFARDKGLPFPQLFSYIHPTLQVPLPALFLMGIVCCFLSLINLGSTVAFNALVALSMVALCISYLIPIVFLTLRQLTGKHPKYGPWRLGRWSMPVKLGAIVYLVYIAVFVPFPTSLPVTAVTMNYAAPIFLGAILLALVDWMARGRNIFEVPTSVVGWEGEEK
jgi:amino acid transporter